MSERDTLIAEVKQFGLTAAICGKWLESIPLRDVQLMWDYVKGMHQKEPKANLAGYMTACLRNSGLVISLNQKAKRVEAQRELATIQDEMRGIRERCIADVVAATTAGWLGLSDDDRVSLWHSLSSVQSRRVPMWCELGIKSSTLERFLVDEKFVGEVCGQGRPVEVFFSEFKAAMMGRFGGEWPKLEGLLAANGYEALKQRVAALEK